MQNLLNPDNALFQFLGKVTDLIIVTLLTLLFSIPIFTIGAALVACHKTMQNKIMDNEQPVSQVFLQAFASNFKQATGFWLIALATFAFLISDFTLTYHYFDPQWVTPLYIMLVIVSFIALGMFTYMFPLIARYQNTLKQHLKNSFYLTLSYLPRTILILAVCFSPVLFALIIPKLFYMTAIIWIIIGVGLIVLLHTLLMRPIFEILEESANQPETEEV